MLKSLIVARRRGCQLATTVPVLLFTRAIALCYELFRSKASILMSKSPIVARRRKCQLVKTVPVVERAVNRQPGHRPEDS